jgi:hypothetical protein
MFNGFVRDDKRVVAEGSNLDASAYESEVCSERRSNARDLSILSPDLGQNQRSLEPEYAQCQKDDADQCVRDLRLKNSRGRISRSRAKLRTDLVNTWLIPLPSLRHIHNHQQTSWSLSHASLEAAAMKTHAVLYVLVGLVDNSIPATLYPQLP